MNLSRLPRLSTKRITALSESGISSLLDLLNFFPRRYVDRTTVTSIGQLHGQEKEILVVGRVTGIRQQGHRRKQRLEIFIKDDTGTLKAVWFRGASYMKKRFSKGQWVSCFGDIKKYGSYMSMAHPDVHFLSSPSEIKEIARLTPVYPSNKSLNRTKVTSKLISRWQKFILKKEKPPEFLPHDLLRQYGFPPRHQAYRMIHFPESMDEYHKALNRFKFEELFLFELSVAKTKTERIQQHPGPDFTNLNGYTRRFFRDCLPFELTEGQKSALSDIKKDVRSGGQMNRLLQGDVGSGKTVVAIGTMLMALDNGFQAALMAPTEILAEQHFHTIQELLAPLDINVRLLVGGQNARLRTDILTEVEGGNCQIVVGTHAVIQEKVHFYNLGLAVVDEQHRFGVEQRAKILYKGSHPHVLVMSATPIPRSLAMTLYSDLDISVIEGLPSGRKPVQTAVRPQKAHDKIYDFVEKEVSRGGQAYVVYPLIEESEEVDLKDATAGYENLKQRFKNIEVGLLHGQMKSGEKEAIMQQFKRNEIQVLISTTVIEVGVDVPNASIMLIEHAERFGLSQLHQLRGRIGRGERQSYCILVYEHPLGNEAQYRLSKMVETSDGFEIAEADLKLRGPGDFMGTKQSGLPEFQVADIVEDQGLLKQAKTAAMKLIEKDPKLTLPAHRELRAVFIPYYKEKSRYYQMG